MSACEFQGHTSVQIVTEGTNKDMFRKGGPWRELGIELVAQGEGGVEGVAGVIRWKVAPPR